MFVSGPGFFQPFGGFQPFGLQPFAQYVDVEPPSRGYFPQRSRQAQRNRHMHPLHCGDPLHNPRYPAAYPWATPGRHLHSQPDVVYDYDSDSDASADEGEEEGYTSYPPHTPVRPAVQPHQASHPRSSSSSSSRSMAQAGVGQAPFWAGARQASPFAPHPERCEPEPQPHWRRQQQHRRPFGEPLKARQPAAAAPQPQAGAAPAPAPGTQHKGARHIAVSSGPQPSAPATPQQPPQQQVPPAAAAPAAPSRPSRQLRKAEAATRIQSWWRMRRLARQQPALHTLMHAAAQLREVAAMFAAYKADVSSDGDSSSDGSSPGGSGPGFITHKQYLELNELAMRVLLQLDCCPCGVPELRAVRKRLAASAMSLLDSIQAAFSAAVNASMEVPDSAVQEALGHTGSKAGPAATTQLQQQSAAQEPQQQEEDVWMDVQEQCQEEQQQQQPDRMDVCEAAAESEVNALAAAAAAAAADGGSLPLPCSSGVSVPVRVVLRVAGQCCDAGTQTD